MREVLKPMFDRVAVRRLLPEERTSSGMIVIPDVAKDKSARGTIINIGQEVKYLQIGDLVLFGKFSGQSISINQEELVLLSESEVLGVITTSNIPTSGKVS